MNWQLFLVGLQYTVCNSVDEMETGNKQHLVRKANESRRNVESSRNFELKCLFSVDAAIFMTLEVYINL